MSEPLYAMIAAAAVGGALFFAGSAVVNANGRGRRTTISRLGSFTEPAPGDPSPGAGRALRRDSAVDQRLGRNALGAWLRRDLQRAGLSWHIKDYIGLIVLAAVIAGLLGLGISKRPPIGFVALLAGALIPLLLVRNTGSRRAKHLNGQIVDVIDVIASSLRAGMSFVPAMELAARDQPEPISGVLARTVHEINIGVSTDEALERMMVRAADQDLELVITAVLIQRRVGGNLAEVLENISQTIRDRIQVKGQIKTLTAQARMSGWIVGLLPVAMAGVMGLIEPSYIRVLFVEPAGRILLASSGVLDILGFFAIRQLSAITY